MDIMYCLVFLAGLLTGILYYYVRTLNIIQDLEKLSRIDKSMIFRFQKKALSNYLSGIPEDMREYLNAIALNKYLSDYKDQIGERRGEAETDLLLVED